MADLSKDQLAAALEQAQAREGFNVYAFARSVASCGL
jgi:hypothetical protein